MRTQASHALQQARAEIAAADHRAAQADKQVSPQIPNIDNVTPCCYHAHSDDRALDVPMPYTLL